MGRIIRKGSESTIGELKVAAINRSMENMSEPTGFNREGPETMGIMEFSPDGNKILRIDGYGNYTELENEGVFAKGTKHEVNASPREFAIYPYDSSDLLIYINSVEHSFAKLRKMTISDVTGLYIIYQDETDTSTTDGLSWLISESNVDYFSVMPIMSVIYWNKAAQELVIFADERHGITMDGSTHKYLHTTFGTKYVSGLGVTGINNNAVSYTHTDRGQIYDEDILLTLNSQDKSPFLYLDDDTWNMVQSANRKGTLKDNNFASRKINGGPLASVTIKEPGVNYSDASTTISVQGDGVGASVTPTFSSGGIDDININNKGSNFSNLNSISIEGNGTGAGITATVVEGKIVGVEVSNEGSSYTESTITISGDGQDATAEANIIVGKVLDYVITDPGSGYKDASAVISSTTGTGATAQVNIIENGPVTGSTITNAGHSYTAVSVEVTGDGTGATAEATLTNDGPVIGSTLTDAGTGYTSATASALISGDGTGATCTVDVIDDGAVTGSTLTAGGTGYTSATASALIDGDGTGATCTVDVIENGPVTSATITAGGTDYTGATTTAVISGDGTGATCTVTVESGAVTGLVITDGGTGYTSATVTITDSGTGTGATADLIIAEGKIGTVSGLTITDGGSGYTSATVTVSDSGTGTGATLDMIVADGLIGTVSGLTITDGGSGYTSATVAITDSGTGTGATANIEIGIGTIESITITNPGTGYTNAIASFNGTGTGATADFIIADGLLNTIESLTILQAGTLYEDATVEITSDTGTGAIVTATLEGGEIGKITSIDITNQGSGYTTAVVDISGNGQDATANAIIEDGNIGELGDITITNAGYGYTEAYIVVDGDGIDFDADLIFDPKGSITNINIASGGSGYTYANIVVDGDGTGSKITAMANTTLGNAQFNEYDKVTEKYSLSELAEGQFSIMYFLATNDKKFNVHKLFGQKSYNDLEIAKEAAKTESILIARQGLPSPELLFMGAVVVNYKGKVQKFKDESIYIDLRNAGISGGVSSTTAVKTSAVKISANDILYNSTVSGFNKTNVQEGIDAAAARIEENRNQLNKEFLITAEADQKVFVKNLDEESLVVTVDGIVQENTEASTIYTVDASANEVIFKTGLLKGQVVGISSNYKEVILTMDNIGTIADFEAEL